MSELISRRVAITKVFPSVMAAGVLAASAKAAEPGDRHEGMAPMSDPLAGAFKDGAYVLPPLPYPYDALEPYIDAETMKLHHDKHHKAYVEGLNKTVKSLAELRAAGGEINAAELTALEEDLSFNAAGHFLHTVFWSVMGPKAGGEPAGMIGDAIAKAFGSAAAFKAQFSKAAASVKGSGWAVLAYEPVGDQLFILQLKQHDLQLPPGIVTLLPLDVWEHAYYLKYHNARADYIKAWWNVVNWDHVHEIYMSAKRA